MNIKINKLSIFSQAAAVSAGDLLLLLGLRERPGERGSKGIVPGRGQNLSRRWRQIPRARLEVCEPAGLQRIIQGARPGLSHRKN